MFRMSLGSRTSDGYVVVSLRGELDLVDATTVAAALRILAAPARWIIVDLSALEFIDAAGVAALSRGRMQARNAGGDLLLAAPQSRVRRVLSLIWENAGSSVLASLAAATASAGSPPVSLARRSGGSPQTFAGTGRGGHGPVGRGDGHVRAGRCRPRSSEPSAISRSVSAAPWPCTRTPCGQASPRRCRQ